MKLMSVSVLAVLTFAFTVLGTGHGQSGTVEEFCRCALESAESTVVFKEAMETSVLAGEVVSSRGSGIAEVGVAITDEDYNRVLRTTHTDGNGSFHFEASRTGLYYIVICRSGYNPLQAVVKIVPNARSGDKLRFILTDV